MKIKSVLSGVGNKIPHQLIISDLIFGVRKYLTRKRITSTYIVIPEITLSILGVDVSVLKKDYNIDFVIFNTKTRKVELILEIERMDKPLTKSIIKIDDCLKNISSIKDAFIVRFDENGKIKFDKRTMVKQKIIEKSTSNSSLLGLNLISILSTK